MEGSGELDLEAYPGMIGVSVREGGRERRGGGGGGGGGMIHRNGGREES